MSEEERAARFLEEQERQMRTVVAKKDTSDDLFKAPEIKHDESVEEKALRKEHVRLFIPNRMLFIGNTGNFSFIDYACSNEYEFS